MSYNNLSRKRISRLSTPVRLGVAAVAACFLSAPVLPNPVNPTVVNGTASFNQVGNVLTVTNSNGAIINWDKFSIKAGETTHFAQTSASSSVMNRVLNDPSAIYGTLSSNGRVWLINPAGIMVGPGGRVDTAGFVASTLNVTNADFLTGRNLFVNDGSAKDVINQGAITTPAGGSVYLIGSNVSNEGIITTPKGETILAAGTTVSLIDSALPGVKVDITGAAGNATNLGEITAEAGRIGIAGVVVRNSGTLNASSVVSEGGRIFLKASQDAYVDGNGRIVTTGTKGGSVEVLGNRVAVMDNARIDASGDAGGGTLLVGGDYQGKNPNIQNASVTYFGPNATLKADATQVGDGGRVILWADKTTEAYGRISARGAGGGNGGFVETSGKQRLRGNGIRVDTGGGTWLLDPMDFTIAAYGGDIDGATLSTNLGSSNIIIQSSDGGTAGSGDIFVDDAVSWAGANYLKLLASRHVEVNQNIDATSGGPLWIVAGWDGSDTANPTTVTGTGNINVANGIFAHGSNLYARAGNNITSTGTGLYQGYLYLKAGGDINVRLDGNFTAETTTSGKSITITDPGALWVMSQGITTVDGDVSLNVSGALSPIDGDIDIGTGTLYLNSSGANTYRLGTGKEIRAGAVELVDGNTVLNGQTDLVLKTDLLTMAAGSMLTSTANMTIQPLSTTTHMKVGGSNIGGILYLSDLSQLTPGGWLQLGSDDGGYTATTQIAGSISLPSNTHVRAGGSGDVVIASGASIYSNTAPRTLVLESGNDIELLGTIGTSSTGSLGLELKPGGIINTSTAQTLTLDGGGGALETRIWGGKSWDNHGTVNLSGNSSIWLRDPSANYATFWNKTTGVVNFNSTHGWAFTTWPADGTGGGVINNLGTINVIDGTAFEPGYNQSSTGTLNIASSQNLSLQNALAISGTIDLNTGGTLSLTENHGSPADFTNLTMLGTGGTLWISSSVGGPKTANFTDVDAGTTTLYLANVMNVVNGYAVFKDLSFDGGAIGAINNGTLGIANAGFSENLSATTFTGNVGLVAYGDIAIGNYSMNLPGDLKLVAGWDGTSPVSAPVLGGGGTGHITLSQAYVEAATMSRVEAKGTLSVLGGATSGAMLKSLGDQDITANGIVLTAGTANGAGAFIAAYGDQVLSVYAGGIILTGNNNGANTYGGHVSINQYGTTGSQTINMYGGGDIVLTAGNATATNSNYSWSECAANAVAVSDCYASGNGAQIRNEGSGNMLIKAWAAGTNILLMGGSGGFGNTADIDNNGSSELRITGNVAANYPTLMLTGGSGGGRTALQNDSTYKRVANEAGVSSNGSLKLYATSVAMDGYGGAATYGGAFIGSPSIDITTVGAFTLTGGTGTDGGSLVQDAALPADFVWMSPAAVGWDKIGTSITMQIGGTLTMASGAMGLHAGSPVVIGGVEGIPATVSITAGAFNSTSTGQFVSRIGTHGTGSVDIITTTGALGLGKSKIGVGSGTVMLSAYGGISQDVLGRVSADALTAEAGTGGTGNLLMPGVNRTAYVDLVAAGAIDYTSYQDFHLIQAKSAPASTVDIRSTSASPYGGDIFINEAGYGGATTVTVTAYGGIYDDNSWGTTNITGNIVTLTSFGGNVGDLAISSDVDATNTITASVSGGSTYGGIDIRDTGSVLPPNITLTDGATTQPGIEFNYGGDIALAGGHTFNAGTGNITINAGGLMSGIQTARFGGTPGVIQLTAGSDISLANAMISSGDIGLLAGGTLDIGQQLSGQNLTLSGSTIDIHALTSASSDMVVGGSTVNIYGGASVAAQNIALGAGTLNVYGGGSLQAANDLTMVATNIYADNGSFIAGNDIWALVAGDITLDNGAYMDATNSVYLYLAGAGSNLWMTNGSYVLAQNPSTIHIEFPARSSGGIMIDGVETTASTPGGSGLFVVNHSTPAAPGAGLDLDYGAAEAPIDPTLTSALNNAVDDAATDKTPTEDNAPPPPDTSGKGSGTTADLSGTGGAADTFGGETSDAAGDKPPATEDATKTASSDKESAKDEKKDEKDEKKDGKDKKSDETKDEKKSDKPAQKKLAQCS